MLLDMEKLNQLYNNGAISEQDFLEQKQRLYKRLDRFDGEAPAAKNGIIYIILGWFLGTIGIHNFYAGYLGRAITQLVLTATSWLFLFIPLLFTAVWAFLEIMLVNHGGNGLFFKGNRKIIWLLRVAAVLWLAGGFYYSDLISADVKMDFCRSLVGIDIDTIPIQ